MNFDMDRSLGFVLNKTSLLSKAHFNQRIKPFDISPEQWSLLYRVVEKSGLTQKELSDSTYKDQANITRSIERLENKGFIIKIPCEADRRSVNLYPTQKGIELARTIVPISRAFNQHLTQGFTPEEAEMLLVLLKKIHKNLEQEEKV
ncbi:MAG: winged helix-turn-helix transcriptional regulator [Campylobacterales bacterium]|nr:winged helix-turn-helix transcriptional regulator [Campylobacterales bacterium]